MTMANRDRRKPPSQRPERFAAFAVSDKEPPPSHATVEDLSAYLPEIKGAYRKGKAAGLDHVLIAAVHRMSDYAKAHGVEQGPPIGGTTVRSRRKSRGAVWQPVRANRPHRKRTGAGGA
jgi:hypothetical protein